jgi:hypothetical protein
MDSDGKNPRTLTPEGLSAFSPAVMPDGRVQRQLELRGDDN